MRQLMLFLLILSLPSTYAVSINEIMYDPGQCPDADCEWVELYNNGTNSVNLAGWKLDNRSISGIIEANEYLIIARDNVSFATYFNASCPVAKAGISLTNSGKNLYLNDSDNKIVDKVSYNSSWGANGNNKTLSKLFIDKNSDATNWRESLQAGGAPCAKNFFEHDISMALEKTSFDKITAFISNNGLSNENILLDFYIDGNISDNDELALASFDSGNVTFALKNLTTGEHIALLNAAFSGIAKSVELNFSSLLPNADVYLSIEINQTINDYSIYNYPENASFSAEVFVMPMGLDEADVFVSEYVFDSEDNWLDAYSEIIEPEIDFGAYDLCAKVLEIFNYNDTNLENNIVCANFTVVPPASQTRMRIKTFASYDKVGLNQTFFWSAQVFPLPLGTVGNLTVALQKKSSRDSTELLRIDNLNLTETIILAGNFTIPEDWIEGIYKVRAKFAYSGNYLDSRDSGQFWLDGLKDIGPANITILQMPAQINFGGFGAVFIKFFSGNYNYEKLKFLVYGYPKQIIADTKGEGITASDFDSDVAVELENVKRGQEIYIALPAFAKQNCDGDYAADNYRTRIRAYDESGKPITTSDVNLQFSGASNFCQQKEAKSSGRRVGGTSLQQRQQQGNLLLEVLEAPDEAEQGESFILTAKISNNLNSTKTIEIYSYVFEGQKIFTEGGWTANRETIELKAKETKEIELENLVKEDAELGTYTLRVRVKDGSKNIDADSTIEIKEKSESQATRAGSGASPLTGAAVFVSKTNTLNPVIALFMFLLVVLVLVLIKSK